MSSITLIGIAISLMFILPSFVSAAGLFNSSQCAMDVNAAFTNAFNSSFLIDSSGSFTNNPNDAWRITYGSCMTLCGSGWEAFDWCFFSTSVSSWVLPWLALIAHLLGTIGVDILTAYKYVSSKELFLTALNSSCRTGLQVRRSPPLRQHGDLLLGPLRAARLPLSRVQSTH